MEGLTQDEAVKLLEEHDVRWHDRTEDATLEGLLEAANRLKKNQSPSSTDQTKLATRVASSKMKARAVRNPVINIQT